jgi:F420-non-reducing hydrogenase small subunit
MALKVIEEWFSACAGCEVSLLNIGDDFLEILKKIEFVHSTFLMDHKLYGQSGEAGSMEFPGADVGLVTGGIRNEEMKHELEELRKRVNILVALGSCACYGGVPAMANMWSNEEVFEKIYRGCVTTEPSPNPSETSPWLDRIYAIDEIVKVDIYIPGCPPHPDWILDALNALLEGKTEWKLPERSVCDTCPLKREKKALSGAIKRPLENLEFDTDKPINEMRCINEQGFLCLGPVTLAGCAGKEGIPRCIQAGTACRGCFGPIRKGASPLVDMMGAMTSIGLDAKTLVDRRTMMNRYIGAQRRLRPLPARPKR